MPFSASAPRITEIVFMTLSFRPHAECFHLLRMIFFLSFFLLGGCAAKEEPAGRCYSLAFVAEGEANGGSPLKIHLFLLTDRSAFMSAICADLQGDINTKLANALLDKKHFFLLPDVPLTEQTLTVVPGAKFIGIFAEYKHIAHQHWRFLLPLEDADRSPLWRRFWPDDADAFKQIIVVSRDGLRLP
ncbi:type VI secretion system lipoprotein TssJ [Sodalis ligni]|uniref:type VI secretion system lipoprotein TssJ n=1 Tax=Sodalis ligni TaxID=2697027 RepID=UPI001BDE0FFB|nr:type VI secretion system lipoprotein TssJ [Sodalis ligni]QWA11541.1 type VI secretion system lipoprotein TssJ [Sodalis ligni]